MKKLTTLLIICCMALMLTFGLTACGDKTCEHIYDNACDAICNECEETRTITHDWNAADCDTPKTCSICGATEGEALGHTAEADDGNCTTDIKCATCGTVLTSGKTQHVAHADDGDCTTPVTCTACSTVVTEAKSHDFSEAWTNDASGHWHVCKNDGCSVTDTKTDHISDGSATEEKAEKCTVCEFVIAPELEHTHEYSIPNKDATNHWNECRCGDKKDVTPHSANNDNDCTTADVCSCGHTVRAAHDHTPGKDDGNCTTAIKCKHCDRIAVAGNASHTPNADDGSCLTAITCQNCTTVLTAARDAHEANADDGDCTTAVFCQHCTTVLVSVKTHSLSGWIVENGRHHKECVNDGCDHTEQDGACSGGTATCVSPATCTVCGNNYGTVNANAHAYGDITYVWTDEYTKCTATRTCSHNAAHKETETVTTTQNGKIFTAVFENAAFGTATIDPSVQIGGVTVKPWEEVPPIDVGEAEEVN